MWLKSIAEGTNQKAGKLLPRDTNLPIGFINTVYKYYGNLATVYGNLATVKRLNF